MSVDFVKLKDLNPDDGCGICRSGSKDDEQDQDTSVIVGHRFGHLSTQQHAFHRKCVSEWFKIGRTICPMCEKNVSNAHEYLPPSKLSSKLWAISKKIAAVGLSVLLMTSPLLVFAGIVYVDQKGAEERSFGAVVPRSMLDYNYSEILAQREVKFQRDLQIQHYYSPYLPSDYSGQCPNDPRYDEQYFGCVEGKHPAYPWEDNGIDTGITPCLTKFGKVDKLCQKRFEESLKNEEKIEALRGASDMLEYLREKTCLNPSTPFPTVKQLIQLYRQSSQPLDLSPTPFNIDLMLGDTHHIFCLVSSSGKSDFDCVSILGHVDKECIEKLRIKEEFKRRATEEIILRYLDEKTCHNPNFPPITAESHEMLHKLYNQASKPIDSSHVSWKVEADQPFFICV
jgi:hypothetical protein